MGSRRSDDGSQEAVVQLVLMPEGRVIRGQPGQTVLDALQEEGIRIPGSCGGQGTCGECRIRFLDGAPRPVPADRAQLEASELADGWRLACAHLLAGTTTIEVRLAAGELDHKARADMAALGGRFAPMVTSREVRFDPPSREDPRPAVVRLRGALGVGVRVPLSALRRLGIASQGVAAIVSVAEGQGEIVDIRAGSATGLYGLALDVGTTTLAAYLLDLSAGKQIGAVASRNPQRRFGGDVIARIAHVRRRGDPGLAELHSAVIDGLNGLVERSIADSGVPAESIYAATVVGNPTMLHLFLGVDPRGIDVSPYAPVFGGAVRCRGKDVGLRMHPRGVVETLPAISAYVGADIVAGILATDLSRSEGCTLFLDVGTNGEIVLAQGGRLVACSTAAGPAFEGASIVQGMAALDGAIESVRVQDGRIECAVIGGSSPAGLCGTGLVSAVAELHAAGVIESSGRFSDVASPLSRRLEGEGKERRFRLTDGEKPVHLHQGDVRQFQLAKAAVRTGIEILLQHAALDPREVDRVLIAGAFSVGLSGEHLVSTGFLPRIDPSRVHVVGNTAGHGARRALLDRGLREDAVRIARAVEYIELSADERFADLYVGQIPLPPG